MASSGAEAAERAHIDVKHRHVLPPSRRDGGATQIGSKRAFQIKLGYGLTSSRASTTFAVTRAGLILHPPTRPIFIPMGGPQAHVNSGERWKYLAKSSTAW